MPRREYTKRSDYNALSVINRHTLTPNGWTHEQFNTKVLRKPDGTQEAIAREFGFNDYRKTTEVDFAPAYAYWKGTQACGPGCARAGPHSCMHHRACI